MTFEDCSCDSDDIVPVEDDNTPIPPPADPNRLGTSASTPPAEKSTETKVVTNGVSKDVSPKTAESKDADDEKDLAVTNGTGSKEDEPSNPETDEKSKSNFEVAQLQMALRYVQGELARRGFPDTKFPLPPYPGIPPPPPPPGMYPLDSTKRPAANPNSPVSEKPEKKTEEEKKPVARVRGSKREYRRLDELYDKGKNTFYLAETHTTSSQKEDEWEEYVFIVKRKFDWQNRFVKSVIDIKSVELQGLLRDHILKGIQGISLVEEKPSILPNDLFNYQPQMEEYLAKEKDKPEDKQDKKLIEHTELLLDYLNEDFAEIKSHLIPLLENGEITFELLWALFLPNSLIFTYCPGSHEPQCLKLDYGEYQCSPARGKFFQLETHLINYDGKKFFRQKLVVDIYEFRGSRRIDDLPFFPLAYHEREDEIIAQLVSRGRDFCKLDGSHNKSYKGIAFHTSKKGLTRVNVDGRIMVDCATFRYINPNYQCAQSRSHGALNGGAGMVDPNALPNFAEEDGNGNGGLGNPNAIKIIPPPSSGDDGARAQMERTKTRLFRRGYILKDGKMQLVGGNPNKTTKEKKKGDEYHAGLNPQKMTEEELLLCSPTVLGFSFPDKLWLELAVSQVQDIEWNANAFDSLVLPAEQKNIVRALVESHTTPKNRDGFDDVVKGKGKGLVAVLHGRPGVGKTLTAEGISEYLRRPLYMVSVGELGTDARTLEHQLSRILEVAHIWGAVLLLDEADVFLERRSVHDLHRNALVSIFLRLLEYFQGILFLTTNRVETFDEAFQSRIHIALRYNDLDQKAKKQIWKTFLNLVEKDIRAMEAEDKEEAAKQETEKKKKIQEEKEAQNQEGGEVEEEKSVEKLPSAKKEHLVDPEGWTKIVSKNELEWLSKRNLNGRQIKNAVRTAHALAGNTKELLKIKHLKTVLQVTESFENDLRGTGQLDSMMSYA